MVLHVVQVQGGLELAAVGALVTVKQTSCEVGKAIIIYLSKYIQRISGLSFKYPVYSLIYGVLRQSILLFIYVNHVLGG